MSLEEQASAKPAVPGTGTVKVRGRRRPGRAAFAVGMPKSIGKYVVLEQIGGGAMGIVYKCRQPDAEEAVAVKVLTASRQALGDLLPRFQREAKATSRLKHPSVVQVLDVGSEGELHYIVMEHIDGCALDQLIGSPELSLAASLRVLIPIARALEAAHEAGVIHRDIKPSNILVPRSGPPKVVDFGLARSLNDGSTFSRSGDIMGTPRYMSPEQVLLPPKDIDARTDIYSLGAVMYELLTGQPPVDGPNIMVLLRGVTDDEPTPVRVLNPAVPQAVSAVCHKALAKERDQRYGAARELAEALERCLGL